MALRVLPIMLALLAAACVSSPVPISDAVALLGFKSACAGHGTAALDSWTESSDPCSGEWRGVTCQRSSSLAPPRVRGIVLEGLGLGGDAGALAALADLPALSFLSFKNNNFTGSLHDVDFSPVAPHLKLLYLSGNAFSGRFPLSILRLRHLRRLDLAGNRLTGAIPPEIGRRLRALVTLRLARNSFVGPLPTSLEAMTMLVELNVSGNHLSGQIPKRLAAAFPASSFAGNPELCGAPMRRRCSRQQRRGDGETTRGQVGRRSSRYRWMVVMIMAAVGAAVATLIATALCAVLWWKKKKKPAPPRASSRTSSTSASREETVRFDGCCEEFDVRALMMGAAEMLGKGAAATTYRVFMAGQHDVGDDHAGVVEKTEGEAVVVKRLRRREGATREDERRRRELVREMGSWRHANIVNLRAFYASAEELLLVFDYIPHGSLHSLLHENRGPARVPLDWQTRLKLAQDAAQGLAYLHGASGSRLSHRHLTSSNILIDAGGNARVADFAMLQLLVPAPPEKALQKQDVRDFGVILLEILTGRSPEDGKVDMPRWVRTVVREEWTSEVFDMELLRSRGAEDEMVALLQVALLCAADDPKERPRMAVVSKMIEDIRNRGSKRSKYSASPSQAGCSYESSPCVSEDTTKSTTASSS
ncbi:probable leucine-rich repeat receptor-like protein kinase At1g68400 [Lolium rigidum]|uniref:probable leucine-rich repeat receptor-like protein kinase At1g68400 n=1 Tax=Lolium rigidum TaxID=89674 RepID=UPI001F5E1B2D|nr:probable leucine-rich repeat receptor-like protein kinase At1g68400 [Lolium rigidum]